MRHATVMLVLLGCLGCRPLSVFTRSEVALTTPLQGSMNANLTQSGPGAIVVSCIDSDGPRKGVGKVALIDVDGLLVNQTLGGPLFAGDNPVAAFQEKLDKTRNDPDVCAVVLRINSPGGGVTACDVMRHLVDRYRQDTNRPVIASIVDVGTGGAYYLATSCDVIVAHPTAVTGGIGVIWNSYNLRDLMAQFNVIPQTIKAGANIDMGSMNQAIPAETKKMLQQMADEYHLHFKKAVQTKRNVDTKDETIFDGRVFTATQAEKRGLVDVLGYLDDALAIARQKAGHGDAQTYMYARSGNPANASYNERPSGGPASSPLPIRMPGLERSRLPTFLYLWQPEPTLDR